MREKFRGCDFRCNFAFRKQRLAQVRKIKDTKTFTIMKLTILFIIAAAFIAAEALVTFIKKEMTLIEEELSGKAPLPGQYNMFSTYGDRAWR